MVNVDQFVSDLSGGNKQKVVLARWIGKDSDIVVLDSPTRGIDIKVKQDIYQLMNQMRKNGKSIIMISEELMELIGMCDRIMIMKDGRTSGRFFIIRKFVSTLNSKKMIISPAIGSRARIIDIFDIFLSCCSFWSVFVLT